MVKERTRGGLYSIMESVILNYWHHKDIPEVVDAFNKLDVDKLEFKYQNYPLPQKELDRFCEISDYDYIMLMTGDTIIKQENIDKLKEDIEEYHYNVISGVVNVDTEELKDYWNICMEEPDGEYKWVKKGSMKGIVKVKFAGFPVMAIHKSVYKKYNFYIENYRNSATDLRFCKWCNANGIKIHVDTDVEMHHMRFAGEFIEKPMETIWTRKIF
jgi:hypothetical protein